LLFVSKNFDNKKKLISGNLFIVTGNKGALPSNLPLSVSIQIKNRVDYDNLRTSSNRKTMSEITSFFDYYLSYSERGVTFKSPIVSELNGKCKRN